MSHSYVKIDLNFNNSHQVLLLFIVSKNCSIGNFGKGLLPYVMRMKVSTVSHLNRSKLSWKLWS